MKLSENFTLHEMVFSQMATRHQIENRPTSPRIYANLVQLASELELVRRVLGNKPMFITSGYRSPRLNRRIGGSSNSAHMDGRAADFICPAFGPPRDVCERIIVADEIEFDQLIYEGSWVHYAIDRSYPRREILTARFREGGVVYETGLA